MEVAQMSSASTTSPKVSTVLLVAFVVVGWIGMTTVVQQNSEVTLLALLGLTWLIPVYAIGAFIGILGLMAYRDQRALMVIFAILVPVFGGLASGLLFSGAIYTGAG